MADRQLSLDDAERIIPRIVDFPDIHAQFERIRPVTDLRKDDSEARVLYICRQVNCSQTTSPEPLYVLKCKIQAPSVLPGGITAPIPGPSAHTMAELQALTKFTETQTPSLPHLISWKTDVQHADGLMPGGYVAYICMTLMPGVHLMDLKFWSLPADDQERIRDAFLPVVKSVWRLGFEPYDCALRNIIWDAPTQTLSLVDFEHWHVATTDPINMNDREEMQKWGIAQRPAFTYHWQEWFHAEGLTAKRE